MMQQTMTVDQHSKKQLLEIVRKWGDTNSDGILEETSQIFSVPHIEGVIGYRTTGKNAVVFGEPLCSDKDKASLAMAFQEYCEQQKLQVVYTMVLDKFAGWAEKNLNASFLEFGQKIVLNPQHDPLLLTGSKAVLLRKKVKHATNAGVIIQEYKGNNRTIEKEIEMLGADWLKSRKGLQIYMSGLSIFDNRQGKRWFYATKDGKIVGSLTLNTVKSSEGWILTNLLISKDASPGTSELLVTSVLHVLEKEQCHYLAIGPLPDKKLGRIAGVTFLLATLTRWAYLGLEKILHLDRQKIFWEKFHPEKQSAYLLFPKKNLNYSSIKAILGAFNIGKRDL